MDPRNHDSIINKIPGLQTLVETSKSFNLLLRLRALILTNQKNYLLVEN